MPKSKIRRIDQGTRYDITGELRRFIRRIEGGSLQGITDCIVITRTFHPPDGQREIDVFGCGTCTIENAHWMLESAKRRIENH